jgi:glycosyltransferase involved in cell wall biosynthesis
MSTTTETRRAPATGARDDTGTQPWRPLRIAMLGTRGVPATYGGIEHQVEEVGARLVERGHEVTVFCRRGYTTPQTTYRGMRLRHLPTVPTKHLEALVHTGVATGAALRGFDVTHYHAIGPGVLGVVPRLLGTSRVVLTVHGVNIDRRSKWGPSARAALRGALWLSRHAPHQVVTVSHALTERYRRAGCPAVYVPNAARSLQRRPAGEITTALGLHGQDYALFLGRLVPEKGPDVLLRAFRQVPTAVRLVVAGGVSHSGPYLDELRTLAGGDDRVLFPGYVYGSLLEELLANAALFVAPSRSEGLPLTLLEAVAVGTPVLASDIEPHHEVLGGDGPGHRLFRAEDPGHLAERLAELLPQADRERDAVPELQARLAGSYSWDRIVDDLERVYLGVATERG